MKKNIFKKIVASLATVAMAAGMFVAAPAEEAKAAETKLYVTGGFCSWGWGEGSGVLTSTDGNVYSGDIEVVGDSEIVVSETGKWGDGDAGKLKYIYNGCAETYQTNVVFEKAGTYTITYNKTTKVLTTAVKSTIEVNWTYAYYIAGPADLGGADWGAFDASKAVKMTKNGDVYTLETTVAKDGDYGFCVVEVKTPDVDDVDPATTWLKDPATGNDFAVAGLKAGTVKFEFKTTDGTCKVTQLTVAGDTPSGDTPSGDTPSGDTPSTDTPAADEKKGVTVEVTLGSEAKWDKVFIYAFDANGTPVTAWPGDEMTAKDGKWYATLDTDATKLSYVISNGAKEQTVDIENVEGTNVKITLGAKNADGKFELATGGVVGTEKPGDVAPVAMMLVVAAVAAAMVVASKKKTICE